MLSSATVIVFLGKFQESAPQRAQEVLSSKSLIKTKTSIISPLYQKTGKMSIKRAPTLSVVWRSLIVLYGVSIKHVAGVPGIVRLMVLDGVLS
jgi:hypothetical protein